MSHEVCLLSHYDCGLCFTRREDLTPLTPGQWRTILGPVGAAERRGYPGCEQCDPDCDACAAQEHLVIRTSDGHLLCRTHAALRLDRPPGGAVAEQPDPG